MGKDGKKSSNAPVKKGSSSSTKKSAMAQAQQQATNIIMGGPGAQAAIAAKNAESGPPPLTAEDAPRTLKDLKRFSIPVELEEAIARALQFLPTILKKEIEASQLGQILKDKTVQQKFFAPMVNNAVTEHFEYSLPKDPLFANFMELAESVAEELSAAEIGGRNGGGTMFFYNAGEDSWDITEDPNWEMFKMLREGGDDADALLTGKKKGSKKAADEDEDDEEDDEEVEADEEFDSEGDEEFEEGEEGEEGEEDEEDDSDLDEYDDEEVHPHVTKKSELRKAAEGKKFILADFYAEWCGPCKQIAPSVKAIAVDYAQEGVAVVKVNVDDAPELAEQFNITGMPTFGILKVGAQTGNVKCVDQVVGADLKKLIKMLNKHLQ